MKLYVFSIICGVVVSIAGAHIQDEPIKTVALIAALVFSHLFLREKNGGKA